MEKINAAYAIGTVSGLGNKYIETNMSAQDIITYGWIFAKKNSANIKTEHIKNWKY